MSRLLDIYTTDLQIYWSPIEHKLLDEDDTLKDYIIQSLEHENTLKDFREKRDALYKHLHHIEILWLLK